MATVMSAKEYASERGIELPYLEACIDEAENDAITKETMNRASLTSRNITEETESIMWDCIKRTRAH